MIKWVISGSKASSLEPIRYERTGFFLEEESAKALLENIVPAVCGAGTPTIQSRFIVFEGKLTRRLRGYLNPQARFIVLRDQD